jgi:CubicO group peptidase (beta-lactamase class C family)
MVENNTELRKQHAPLSKFVESVVRDTVPLFRAGTDFKYQSMGTLMVAELVRLITGQTVHEFAKKEIFEPLGLKSTSFGAGDIARERLVRNQTSAGQSADYGWNSTYWRELGAPWGGMFSTPEEYAVICQLMLNGGTYDGVRILAPTTAYLMTTNRLDDHPDVPVSVRLSKPWGLGWQMNHPGHSSTLCEILGRHVYGHLGATGTLCWMDPETDGFCLILTNYERDRAPWRLLRLSNAVAAAFEN